MVPTRRKVLISKLLSFTTNETRSAAPTTDIKDIRANTDDRKENKYNDAKAEMRIPSNMKSRVDWTMVVSLIFRILATSTPRAKALESIVPMKAAIRETVSNDPSHPGKIPNTPPVNKLDGSSTTPANLKFIPRYAIDPATRVSRTNAITRPLFRERASLLANTL